MENFFNTVSQSGFVRQQNNKNDIDGCSTNPISEAVLQSFRYNSVSSEYADAAKTLALSQINLGNNAKFYSPELIYKRSKI